MEKTGRNDKCPCGSGKKFKKCCADKKPRGNTLSLDFPASGIPMGLRYDGTEFQLLYHDGSASKPTEAYLESHYDRGRKPKVLHRIQLHPSLANGRVSINDQLAQYQSLVAVDANTVELPEGQLSVCAVVLALYKERSASEIHIEVRKSCLIEVRDLQASVAERYGLFHILQMLESDPKFQQGKMGVIIDHNLSHLNAFNSRKKEIVDDYYLPSNAELIYATADSGVENLPNKLIRDCDTLATQFVAYIRADAELRAGNHLVLDEKGNRCCMWTFSEGDSSTKLPLLRL